MAEVSVGAFLVKRSAVHSATAPTTSSSSLGTLNRGRPTPAIPATVVMNSWFERFSPTRRYWRPTIPRSSASHRPRTTSCTSMKQAPPATCARLGDILHPEDVHLVEQRTVFRPVSVEAGQVEDRVAPSGERVDALAVQQVSEYGVVLSFEVRDRHERGVPLEKRDRAETLPHRRAQQVRPDESVRSGDADPGRCHCKPTLLQEPRNCARLCPFRPIGSVDGNGWQMSSWSRWAVRWALSHGSPSRALSPASWERHGPTGRSSSMSAAVFSSLSSSRPRPSDIRT